MAMFDQSAEKTVNSSYKYCFVPKCSNTTKSTPGKIFITVPKGDVRKKWIQQTRRDSDSTSLKSTFYCCEDHFDVSFVNNFRNL